LSQLPPAARPPDTFKVRGRLRGVWLALWLAGAAGCVALGIYDDTPESPHEWWWLPLFLLLAAVSVVLAVRSFGRGIDADSDGVVVRNTILARPIRWRELAAIEFKGVSSEAITNMYYQLVFQRHDGSRVTAEAPGGGARPGEDLFELRERLLAMRDAAFGDHHAPADRPSDAASTDEEAVPPAEPPSWVPPPWSGSTDTEAAPPATAAQSRVKQWGEVVAGVAVILAIVFVSLPDLWWSVLGDDETTAADSPAVTTDSPAVDADGQRVYWGDLQPGMCVREVPDGMEDAIVVDCGVEHVEEVMSRGTLAGSREWPGDAAVEDSAGKKCKSVFASYVGLKLADSRLDFDFLTPDEFGWTDGKVTLICLVLDPNDSLITRSLRGAHE
jgi:hypothetical protein